MPTRGWHPALGFTVFLTILSLWTSSVTAELYIAGQGGITLPHALSNIREYKPGEIPTGSTLSDLALKSSLMYGAKVGYFFESRRWLGVELEMFHTTPHVKQQRVTETLSGSTPTEEIRPGARLLVTTIAINAVMRHRVSSFEPYIGIGAAVFIAQMNGMRRMGAPPLSVSSDRPGLNTQLGLRHYMNDHLTVFGEWKFNYSPFYFDSPEIIRTTYRAHHLAFGIGYHF